MNITKKISLLVTGVIAVILFVSFSQGVFGGYLTNDVPTQTPTYKTYEFFASTTLASIPTTLSTTTSATSTNIIAYFDSTGRYDAGYFVIAGAKKVSLLFGRGGAVEANTGSTEFKVQVTPNGTDWYDFSKLVQATSTTLQATTVISAATSTQIFGLDISKDSFYAIRCIAVETIDGEHRCRASAEWN